ncbi:MAG TPA: hypothetical protein VJR24_07910 [Gemmatimonadaceae bacterium]|nr:hypothetical protein [Gemmatimonadaceae bacterium]
MAEEPKESVRTLTAEEAAEFDAFKASGTAKDVKAQIDKVAPLEAFKAETQASVTIDQAAKVLGWHSAVLANLAKHMGLSIGMHGGELHVKTAADQVAFAVPLTQEYAEKHFAELLPALMPAAMASDTRANGIPFPAQSPSTSATGGRREATQARATDVQRRAKINTGIHF